MAGRKTGDRLRAEIREHNLQRRELHDTAWEIQKSAILIGMGKANVGAFFLTMKRALDFQQLAVSESAKAIQLERILLKRQIKDLHR